MEMSYDTLRSWQMDRSYTNFKSSAAKVLSIMRKLRLSFSGNALNQIYFSYLLPVFEYASITWEGCAAQNSDILDKIQNEAAGIVTGLIWISCTRNMAGSRLLKKGDSKN